MTALPIEAHCTHLAPLRAESRRRLGVVLGLTVTVMAVEIAGGFAARSLALLADAGHMLADAAAIGLALAVSWIAQRPATAERSYGLLRLEILAALANGVALVVVAIGIVREAWERLAAPPAVRGGLLLGVAAVGLVANIVATAILHRGHGHSLNERGAYLHVLSDLLGSIGAVVAGAVVLTTDWTLADPLISAGIALLILGSAWRLVRESVDVLLEATPSHIPMAEVHARLATVPGVTGVHDLHVWTVTSGVVAMSAHLVVAEGAVRQQILDEARARLRAFGIRHATVQVEGAGCEETAPVDRPTA